jgi:Zn-dependent M28 family amino/carboxypeptidase
LVIAGLALVLGKATMFGWRCSKITKLDLSQEDLKVSQALKQTVKYLSQDIGLRDYLNYKNLEKSAQFIKSAFKNLGFSSEVMHYSLQGKIFKNIIARKMGSNQQANTVILGAHYDSCFNPGADDNASGVAVLLELARQLKDESLRSDVEFIAFVNEEPPFFLSEDMGSRVYARKAKKQGKTIKAAVILESVGYYRDEPYSQTYPPPLGLFYPQRGNFIAFVSNFASGKILKSLVSAFKKTTDFPVESFAGPSFIPGVSFSDHWSFWQEGFPAVMVTDTAFLRNPNYHADSDVYTTLDYQKMALVVKGLKATLIELANRK